MLKRLTSVEVNKLLDPGNESEVMDFDAQLWSQVNQLVFLHILYQKVNVQSTITESWNHKAKEQHEKITEKRKP